MKRPRWLQRVQPPQPPALPPGKRLIDAADMERLRWEELYRAKRLIRRDLIDILRGPLKAEQKVRFLAMALGVPLDTESIAQAAPAPPRDARQQFLDTNAEIPQVPGAFARAHHARLARLKQQPGQP